MLSALDEGQSVLRTANSYADRILPNTNRDGTKKIRSELDQNKEKYDKLKKALAAKKAELESANNQWADVGRVHDQLDGWLNDCEARTAKSAQPRDLTDKKTELERCKVSKSWKFTFF